MTINKEERKEHGIASRISGYVLEKSNMIFRWEYSILSQTLIKLLCYKFRIFASITFSYGKKKIEYREDGNAVYNIGIKMQIFFLFSLPLLKLLAFLNKTRHFYYLPSMIHLAQLQRNMSAYRSMLRYKYPMIFVKVNELKRI